jgi:hypothetical protein
VSPISAQVVAASPEDLVNRFSQLSTNSFGSSGSQDSTFSDASSASSISSTSSYTPPNNVPSQFQFSAKPFVPAPPQVSQSQYWNACNVVANRFQRLVPFVPHRFPAAIQAH